MGLMYEMIAHFDAVRGFAEYISPEFGIVQHSSRTFDP